MFFINTEYINKEVLKNYRFFVLINQLYWQITCLQAITDIYGHTDSVYCNDIVIINFFGHNNRLVEI